MAIDNIPLTVTENTQEVLLDIDDTSHPYYVGARAYVTQIPQGAIVTVIDKFGRTEATLLDGNYGNITDIAYDPDTRTIKKVNGVVVSDLVTLSEVAISNDYGDLDNLPDIDDIIDAHPVSNVQDGAISYAKLHNSLKAYVTPEMFGAAGDGVTDDTNALNAAFSSDAKRVHLSAKYKVTDTIDASNVEAIISDNAEIFGEVANPILLIDKFGYEKLGNLVSDVAKHKSTFSYAGLSNGDDFAVVSTDLYNPARLYYNKGEFNTYSSSGLAHSFYDSYLAATSSVYKLSFGSLDIVGNLSVRNNLRNANATAILLKGIKDANICGLVAESYGSNAIAISRCYKVSLDANASCYANDGVSYSTDYGLAIVNSQDVVIKGIYYGNRHAVATGGDSDDINIPDRNIKIDGIFHNNPLMRVGALDTHGNVEYVHLSGIADIGVSIGGKNITVENLTIKEAYTEEYGLVANGLYGAEQLAGKFILSNIINKAFSGAQSGIHFSVIAEDNPEMFDVTISNVITETSSEYPIRVIGTLPSGARMSLDNASFECTNTATQLVRNATGTTLALSLKNVASPTYITYGCTIANPDNMLRRESNAASFSVTEAVTNVYDIEAIEIGGVKRIYADLNVTPTAANTYTTLFTLPAMYRPARSIAMLIKYNANADMRYLSVSNYGVVGINFPNTNAVRITVDITFI